MTTASDPTPDPTPRRPTASYGTGGRPKGPGVRGLVAAALAAGATAAEAGKAHGVGRRTVARWMADPKFRQRVTDLRDGAVAAGLNRLSDSMSEAARTLVTLMAHPDPNVKHKAAVKVLEISLKAREQLELAERLAELERVAKTNPAAVHPPVPPPGGWRTEDVE